MTSSPLGQFSPEEFLRDYWQKRPCLIRQAIPEFESFISKSDLIELADDDDVESRLVLENDGDYPWQVLHGPLEAEIFAETPNSHWTLLVQNVNTHLSEAAEFLNRFNFIPKWRVDDLMISFASDKGGVGAHLDSYDVFLYQASGKRSWSINENSYSEDDFIEGLDLRIIKNFKAEEEWQLEPGDMLYLPPGVAHQGVALGDSMTFSIGFRAPSNTELLMHFVENLADIGTESRYSDPDLSTQKHSGEIRREHLRKLSDLFHSGLPNKSDLETLIGEYLSAGQDNIEITEAAQEIDLSSFTELLARSECVYKKPALRCLYKADEKDITVFFNGESQTIDIADIEFAQIFSSELTIKYPLPDPRPGKKVTDFLLKLYKRDLISIA